MTDKSDKPVVNLAILQSVEDYVETSGKFRTKCASFKIPGRDSGGANTLYIPYCDKQRFDFGEQLNDYRGHGVFIPPEMGKRWSRMDYEVFRTHFEDIHCPRTCRGYRNKTVAALLDKVWSVFSAKLHKMPIDSPATPPSVLKQAINAVPAVKYALGLGGIAAVIAIIRSFGIDFRVAFLGAFVMLVLMTVLLVFANASSRPQSTFKVPAIVLTWFCLVLFMVAALLLLSSAFFGKPLDLRTLLAPVHAGQMPVEKHGTAEVLPYVNVQAVKVISFEVGKPPEAVATYKNAGLTPATNGFVIPSSFIREQKNGGLVEPVIDSHWNACVGNVPPQIRDSMGSVIPPGIVRDVDTLRMSFGWDFTDNGQERNGILTNIPLEQDNFDAVKYGRKRWYVVVYISYRDKFGGCHSSAEPFVYDFLSKTMEPSLFNAKQYDQNPN